MLNNSKYLLILLIGLSQSFANNWENIQLPLDYFKASNTNNNDRFGTSVAISGNTMVIGAPEEDSNGDELDNSMVKSGAVYVFIKSANGWHQQAYLKASNIGGNDYFGVSVAIYDNTIVVGAIGESSNTSGINGNQSNDSSINSGAAYVYTRNNNNWSQQAYLKASNTGMEDAFGTAVGVYENTIVVGAIGEADNAGAAYVFKRTNNLWSQDAFIKASNPDSDDQFGISVAISSRTIAIGADGEQSNATGINGNEANNSTPNFGAVYIFINENNNWSQQAYIKASVAASNNYFGKSVDIDGDNLVIGAWGESTDFNGNSATHAGSAYAFSRNEGIWSQTTLLKGHNTGSGDSFGWSVAISDHNLIIGANGESSSAINIDGDGDDNSVNDSGAAYVFSCINGNWIQKAYVKASNTGFFSFFGHSLDIENGIIAIGAFRERNDATGINNYQTGGNFSLGNNSGSAYTYFDDIIFANRFETSACASNL